MTIKQNIEVGRLNCKSFHALPLALLFISMVMVLTACGAQLGKTVISKPDEYTWNYEAKEKFVLRAIAKVFKEKNMGSDVRIDEEKQIVETDFIVQDDWRTKSLARVKKLNWKESEVTLSVTTEKRTASGWEMRRLLDREKYTKIFDTVELKIYEEMYKIE